MENSTRPASNPTAANVATSNGAPGQQTHRTDANEVRRQATQRAEELVDRWGEQIGHCAASFGHSVLKWAARAREEAEDIWAEAQAIRERQRVANDQSEGTRPVKG
jgi:hypothetical protein